MDLTGSVCVSDELPFVAFTAEKLLENKSESKNPGYAG